ncbi:MAG: DUF541 domain-containing protein [Sphingobacteriales bacterium]|nr:MAG: DUF541 domain-containing protein [Sphingobacteriales bacterium]
MRIKLYTLILITISITFPSIKSASQTKTEETLQIEVADTIELVPEVIVLGITFSGYYADELLTSIKKSKESVTQRIQIVKKIAAKYSIDSLYKVESFLNDRLEGLSLQLYTISFSSIDKIKFFINEIGEKVNIRTFIYQLKNSKTEYWDKELFKKVMEKAKKEAEFIATQSGKKILSISELKVSYDSDQPGGWTSYPPLSMVASYKNINSKEKIILYKKITVKFNWQNN